MRFLLLDFHEFLDDYLIEFGGGRMPEPFKNYSQMKEQQEYIDRWMKEFERRGIPYSEEFTRYMPSPDKFDERYGKKELFKKEKETVVPIVQTKKKELILCPEHGNAMLRRKDDDEHLYCTVLGCKKVLKRKGPRDTTPEPDPAGEAFKKPIAVVKEAEKEFSSPLIPAKPVGYQRTDWYSINRYNIRVHGEQIGGVMEVWLIQENPDGTDSRICLAGTGGQISSTRNMNGFVRLSLELDNLMPE